MKILKKSVCLFLCCAALFSCTKELDNPVDLRKGLNVQFVFGNGSRTTKALPDSCMTESQSELYILDEESGLKLEETVSSLDEMIVATKGTPVYTENLSTVYPSIAATAYNAVTYAQWGNKDVKFDYVTDSENRYLHNYEDDQPSLEWPAPKASSNLMFFLRAPYVASGDPCSDITYTYSASAVKTQFSYTSPTKAQDQKDLLFSSKEITYEKRAAEDNDVILFHPLTGVKFKLSDDCIADKVTITKVKFENVVNKGACTVDTKGYNSSTQSRDVVSWNIGETPSKASFEQAYSATLVTATKENSGFADSFYTGNTAKNNLNDANFSLTFWFIPQSLDNVSMTVYFKINGGAEQSSKVTFGIGKSWKAGELHTYTLVTKGAGVTISDTVSGLTKTDPVITNTGNLPEYFRVAIIANWVNAAGGVVAPCTPSITGLGSNWSLNSKDGYYYYSKPVNPGLQPGQAKEGDTVDYLFRTYTAPTLPAGADHLVMDLMVQAIDTNAKTYKEAWAEAAGVSF